MQIWNQIQGNSGNNSEGSWKKFRRINIELAKPCAKPSQVQYDSGKDSGKNSGKGFGKNRRDFLAQSQIKFNTIREKIPEDICEALVALI